MEYNWVLERYKQMHPDPIAVENQQCNLVGGSGLIVQMILGFLSFTVLVYKRTQEKPQRPFKIWLLDSSKQVLSSLFAHLANMIFSIVLTTPEEGESIPPPSLISNHALYIYGYYQKIKMDNNFNLVSIDEQNDPCNYYFVTVVIDTSCGVFLACFLLLQLDNLLKRKGCENLRTGNYYKETKVFKKRTIVDENQNIMNIPMEDVNYIEIDYLTWLIQLAIWLTLTFISKMILFFVQALLKYPLGLASYFLLYWLNSMPVVKLVFVMIIIPTIMNGMQFWIQDNVLKKKSYAADTEDIEEDDQDNEDIIIKKNFYVSELYANEEQYSTQMQRHIERRDSKILPNTLQVQQPSIDSISQLHNVSFTKNYHENKKKDSFTVICSEITQNIQNTLYKGDTNQAYEGDQSSLNKGFVMSSINTPVNSEFAESTPNVLNANILNNNNNKFSKFKDIQLDRSPTTESMGQDLQANSLQKFQSKQKSNQILEEVSQLSQTPQKNANNSFNRNKPY
ncbi:vaculolar membrane protein (macronuclear) [Tetrahymena thermophila SB210]|uniref:Vaculolar membrane protein n=1 Tax=Tetrahymena thermophila (strain SB210) TaxID=312017 RepID=I7MH73_TETTS|nr:vaculolar membrane protein [Tetrahymena thermophila SB210]EAR87294.1 vaculolar membrane protein [Tetrahymena thermophila SB210]|eukprot:XP_001007539.1 vaculolar membrane protein [Tetrahymena thermophila SB210]